jgi:hypothetical protein
MRNINILLIDYKPQCSYAHMDYSILCYSVHLYNTQFYSSHMAYKK